MSHDTEHQDPSPESTNRSGVITLALACAALAATGCGGGDRGSEGDTHDAGDSGPLFVVSTNVFGPDNITGYAALVPSLDASVTNGTSRKERP